MSYKGKLNIYVCESCKGHIVTRDDDEGVTPFTIECKATKDCKPSPAGFYRKGTMQSSMYRVFDQTMKPDYVWRKPTNMEYGELTQSSKRHVDQGGLMLYKFEEQPQ